MTDNFSNQNEVRLELIKKLIEENKKIERTDNTTSINTRNSNKIIKDLLDDLE